MSRSDLDHDAADEFVVERLVLAVPERPRDVEEAGDDPKAKDACLPPEPETEAAEPTPEEQALQQCAEAADKPKEKNACLNN